MSLLVFKNNKLVLINKNIIIFTLLSNLIIFTFIDIFHMFDYLWNLFSPIFYEFSELLMFISKTIIMINFLYDVHALWLIF